MAIFYREVEVTTEVDVDINVRDFYNSMDDEEETEMLQLIKNGEFAKDKDFYLSNMIYGETDSQVLNNETFLKQLAYFLKYEDSTLLEFIKEELQ